MITDAEMIASPDKWPRYPVLPIVSKGHAWKCALLFAEKTPPYKVYLKANLYGLEEIPGTTWGEKLSNFEVKEYATAAELLSEWRVD